MEVKGQLQVPAVLEVWNEAFMNLAHKLDIESLSTDNVDTLSRSSQYSLIQ
jgi:hypothetical protein